jgi:hypothetical protein
MPRLPTRNICRDLWIRGLDRLAITPLTRLALLCLALRLALPGVGHIGGEQRSCQRRGTAGQPAQRTKAGQPGGTETLDEIIEPLIVHAGYLRFYFALSPSLP